MSRSASSEDLELQRLVVERLASFRRALGPRLRRAYDDLAVRLGLGRIQPDEDFTSYFLAPFALPVLQLPRWVCRAAERAGSPLPGAAGQALVEAAAVGYLHVRVQDDLLDEGVGRPAEAMLLAEAFFVRHQRLLASVVGDDERFWQLFQERWWDYQDAMLLEHDLMGRREGYDAAAFEQVLRRSQPLVLPAAAGLVRAGLAERLPHLEALVAHLVKAHQLFHDLIDADKDLQHGNFTHVVQRLGGGAGRAALIRRLVLEGGFDEVAAEAMAALDRSEAAAEQALLPEAVASVRRRRQLMEQVRREVFEAFFRRILAKGRGSD